MSNRTWTLVRTFAFHGVLGGWLLWTFVGLIFGGTVNVFIWIVVSYSIYLIWNIVMELLDEWQEDRWKRVYKSQRPEDKE